MQQYIIVNERYSGEAVVTYNAAGTLVRFDTSKTNLAGDTLIHFKNAVPATLAELEQGKGFTASTTIIQVEYQVAFAEFWQLYPLKRNRYKAEELWKKMAQSEQIAAFDNLTKYVAYCKRNSSWLSPMLADRYLRSREYETDWNAIK